MKYNSFIIVSIIIALFSGCKDSTSSPDELKSGTIQLSVSGTSNFNNHKIYFSIWDSYNPNTGEPAGVMRGVGFFVVKNGAGSALMLSPDARTVNLFKPGKYFPFYFTDMNDNFNATTYMPDSGDYVGGGKNYQITVEGDVVKQLTLQDFTVL